MSQKKEFGMRPTLKTNFKPSEFLLFFMHLFLASERQIGRCIFLKFALNKMIRNQSKAIYCLLCVFIWNHNFSQLDTEFWFVAPEVTLSHGDQLVVFVFHL